jgi:Acetyltransferase (GNAT) domain
LWFISGRGNRIRNFFSVTGSDFCRSDEISPPIPSFGDKEPTLEEASAVDCRIREIRLNEDLKGVIQSWKRCNSSFRDHSIHCDPDWIAQHFKQESKNVHIYLLQKGQEILGAVPFALYEQPLLCRLGDSIVAKFPMRVLDLQGFAPNLPASEAVYDMMFDQILTSDFDAIHMSSLKTESFLWGYLHNSPLVRRFFRYYSRGTSPHLLIHLNESFDNYMSKFSAKTRKNRYREIKQLRERGEVQLVRVSEAYQIDPFLESAYAISRKTRQFDRFGWGIAGRDTDSVREELQLLAQRGWLRSYLLQCGGTACSFILGHQYGPRFHPAAAGVDPSWSSFSVGTVILLLVLKDLFAENSPAWYDLGSYSQHKEHFANQSYPEASVWLFRRRPYPLIVSRIYQACNSASTKAAMILDRLSLKESVKRLIWK